jgi:hypothetical protein
VSLTPKCEDTPALFLINLYLPSHSDSAKAPILLELAIRYGVRVLMGGDFNFTEDPEDGVVTGCLVLHWRHGPRW